ncbi:uncharacterized protein LOC110456804 isoform X2 [Mizuhopecten yessoensis]|uniref:uncharacterized protein LOC110456804 isoform X2 n=1 Tax=Mizuhopecten yessoensis TaxID=6573 RepID=UPI000B45EDBE|nr:uncharacterized protein LOC110456804 isoform X2 [Mizuhopecten yessoensis]
MFSNIPAIVSFFYRKCDLPLADDSVVICFKMKTHPAKYYLNTLSNNQLETFTGKDIDHAFQEIYEAEMKKKRAQIMRRLKLQTKQHSRKMPTFVQRTPLCQTFKKPASQTGSSPFYKNRSPVKLSEPIICSLNTSETEGSGLGKYTRSLLQTPILKDVKLINMSYSQPSTPKVNFNRTHQMPYQTPCLLNRNVNWPSLQNLDVPLTPLLNDPLNVFEVKPGSQDFFPLDILQMIDDDTKPVESVDKELHRYTDVTLSDLNVADYLLDIAEDYTSSNNITTIVQDLQPQQVSHTKIVLIS